MTLNQKITKLPPSTFLALLLFMMMLLVGQTNNLQAQELQQAQERLNQLEGEIEASKDKRERLGEQAEEEEGFLTSLSSELVLRAERSRIQENLLTSIEENIVSLNSEINTITSGLMEKRGRLSELLAALERLSQHPPALVLLRPNESLDTIRSASLLSHILPAIRDEAEKLKQEMTVLETAKTELNQEKNKEKEALNILRQQRDEMNVLVQQRQEIYNGLLNEASTTDNYIARLVEEAETLEALLESLVNNRPGPGDGKPNIFQAPENYPSNRPITQAKGSLAFPVSGVVSAQYNSQTIDGRLKGLRVNPDSDTQVIAPYDGQVVFSGVFRNYGQLLIIDHGEGYHSLLSGLNNMYGTVGQWVLTGEPVGLINKINLDSDGANANDNHKINELYIEMRHQGAPINPTPWLAPIKRANAL